jgi:quinol-cytochrome oxidoreductase complex cytochrome b subunit
MSDDIQEGKTTRLMRIWRSIRRDPLWPEDDRGRMRLTMNDLILHLHPPRTPAAALRWTYTYGLGGLSIVLLLLLLATGVLLMFAYTPSPTIAYSSITNLETQIRYGWLIRSVHHWSGNLMLITVFLHMLRVFYTAAFHPPREFNWQLGLALLGLVTLAQFTGYLLPWDQLAFWAATIANGMIQEIPLIGEGIARLLLGGDEVSAATLTNFYAVHGVVIPLLLALIVSFHIFRVRKDGITVPPEEPPQKGDEPVQRGRLRMVTVMPHLVSREMIFALVVMLLLLGFAIVARPPLEPPADPLHPPNPAKTAWYFLGIQELLLHFHPFFGAFILPALTVAGLIVIPYMQTDYDNPGVYFRSKRGRGVALLSYILGTVATVALVLVSEYILPAQTDIIFNGLLPTLVLMAGAYGFNRLLRARGVTRAEARMALFTLLLAAFITLTVIGNFFRGINMALTLPF